ncbi:MAG: recombinase zinc beta ribbon domain-containing protein [Acidimicrobiales bacterium]
MPGARRRSLLYRYYACRNRQTKGTYGCRSKRVPAEDLESAVIDDLIGTLSRSDLFEQAIAAAIADVADNRPCLEAELASTDTQLREAEAGLNHYLRAFETGEMPAAVCSPRVAELRRRRDELAAHRKELARQLEAASPQPPTSEQLRTLRAQIHRVIEAATPRPSSSCCGS